MRVLSLRVHSGIGVVTWTAIHTAHTTCTTCRSQRITNKGRAAGSPAAHPEGKNPMDLRRFRERDALQLGFRSSRSAGQDCLPADQILDNGDRRFRLGAVIVIAVVVAVGMVTGIPATTTLVTITGIVAAAAVVSSFVLKGSAPKQQVEA